MLTDKAQIKLIILGVYYAFDVEMKESDASASIAATEAIHPSDCEECTGELCEEGLLHRCRIENEDCCGITPRGVFAYRQGEELVKPAVRDELIARALRHFESICSGRKYESHIEEAENGFVVVCSLRSEKITYMETRFYFTDRAEAMRALSHCLEKPEVVYSGVETLITGKITRML